MVESCGGSRMSCITLPLSCLHTFQQQTNFKIPRPWLYIYDVRSHHRLNQITTNSNGCTRKAKMCASMCWLDSSATPQVKSIWCHKTLLSCFHMLHCMWEVLSLNITIQEVDLGVDAQTNFGGYSNTSDVKLWISSSSNLRHTSVWSWGWVVWECVLRACLDRNQELPGVSEGLTLACWSCGWNVWPSVKVLVFHPNCNWDDIMHQWNT